MGSKNKKKDKKKSNGRAVKMSRVADKHALYQKSVQEPGADVHFLRRIYKSTFKRKPKVLREDFCGTAAVCCEWVKKGKDTIAYGVDLDQPTLDWGQAHNLSPLSSEQADRVHLVHGDVRTAETPKADVIAAENFSYCIFKTRESLRAYFKDALSHLADDGLLICDLFGGYESIEDDRQEVTEHEDFAYVWDQHKFNPITHDAVFHIHFRFPDGSEIQRAFTYEWRLWTIPEVRELMLEAGFDRADAYWEDTDDKTGDGNGVFQPTDAGDSDPAWNAYIVGVKDSAIN